MLDLPATWRPTISDGNGDKHAKAGKCVIRAVREYLGSGLGPGEGRQRSFQPSMKGLDDGDEILD
jgi:hypothetical protein